jgi:cytochrome c oxidase subunit II
MMRHIISTAVLWAGLTAIGEALVFLDMFPTLGSTEAKDFDEIFRILLFMGIPVFCFAVAMLIYSFTMFRGQGTPGEAGPAQYGRGAVPRVWLAITGSLAVAVMIFPGLTGLSKLQSTSGGYGWGSTEGEITVKVTGQQFSWTFEFPQYGVATLPVPGTEVLLPEHTRIKFEIDSVDVIHSFWVPAFRMKIDAIPGRTTFMTVDTEGPGNHADDSAFRVQCAELCGLNHTTMFAPVRVVSREAFDAWVKTLPAAPPKSAPATGGD